MRTIRSGLSFPPAGIVANSYWPSAAVVACPIGVSANPAATRLRSNARTRRFAAGEPSPLRTVPRTTRRRRRTGRHAGRRGGERDCRRGGLLRHAPGDRLREADRLPIVENPEGENRHLRQQQPLQVIGFELQLEIASRVGEPDINQIGADARRRPTPRHANPEVWRPTRSPCLVMNFSHWTWVALMGTMAREEVSRGAVSHTLPPRDWGRAAQEQPARHCCGGRADRRTRGRPPRKRAESSAIQVRTSADVLRVRKTQGSGGCIRKGQSRFTGDACYRHPILLDRLLRETAFVFRRRFAARGAPADARALVLG